MTDSVDQKTFAALRGVKPPLVTRWKQRGWLVLDADGRVLVAESNAKLDQVLHPGRGGRRDGGQSGGHSDQDRGSYVVQAAREKAASAQLKELELATRAKAVLPASDVREAVLRRVGPAKALLLSLPRRCAGAILQEFAGPVRMMLEGVPGASEASRALGDASAIERILARQVSEACATLSAEAFLADASRDAA